MKKKTTNEVLAESFLELAAQKDVSKITILEIVKNSGMSSPTFYRHFHDKYDLIEWIYRQKCMEIFQRFDTSSRRQPDIAAAWVRFCAENKALLLNLMNNTSGYESFLRSMVKEHVGIIEDDVIARNGREAITQKTHLLIYMHSSGVIRLMFAWLTERVPGTPEEIAEVIYESIPEALLELVARPRQKKQNLKPVLP